MEQTRAFTALVSFPLTVWFSIIIIIHNMPAVFSGNIFINYCSGNLLNSERTDVAPLNHSISFEGINDVY